MRPCSLKALTLILVVLFSVETFADHGAAHRRRQTRPIRMGVSGGNNTDITSEFCCSGTLGALVKDRAGNYYVLSNNHVIATNNTARRGDPIGQPGLIDVRCTVQRAEPVGFLSNFIRIRYRGNTNRIDAALAQIVPGLVSKTGRILDIGKPGQPKEAAIGMPVKKSGRTTGRTVGRITVLNLTTLVEFPNECGSNRAKNARFVDQFFVEPIGPRDFVRGGDSGSLIVERTRRCPASIGLLFAGDSEGNAVGNRIQRVLNTFNVSVVGCGSSATAAEFSPNALTMAHPMVSAAVQVQKRNEAKLMRIPGVVGVGVGETAPGAGDVSIVVFVKKGIQAQAASTAIPDRIDNLPVRRVITSGFRAM